MRNVGRKKECVAMAVDPILSKLQALCVKREYCRYDITQKAQKLLKDEPNPEEKLQAMVDSLVEDGFVSDLRYSSAYAREKASISGWGPLKIRTALLSKRIERSVIDEALGEVDDDRAQEKLRKVLQNKWRSLSEDPQGKLKLIRFALSRGYDYDSVRPVVEDIVSASD